MSREDPQLKLRLPQELKERVEEAARQNRRSVNAELVARVEESFELNHSVPADKPFGVVTESGQSVDGSLLYSRTVTAMPPPNQLMAEMYRLYEKLEQLTEKLVETEQLRNKEKPA